MRKASATTGANRAIEERRSPRAAFLPRDSDTALLAILVVGASPAFAQCAAVEEDGCEYEGNSGCDIDGGYSFGSLEWDLPDGCLASCPGPEHCTGGSVSIQETQDRLASTIRENDHVAILRLADEPQVMFNAGRRAIQFLGCDNESVIGHVSLSDRQVAAVLSATQAIENAVTTMVPF